MDNLEQLGGNLEDHSNDTSPTDSFFEQLEAEVNGGIADDRPVQATPQPNSGPGMETRNETVEGPDKTAIDWEKRYKDSSREATRMRGELDNLKPFVPLLDVMKKDHGLVDHVRGYLENGGAPSKNVKEELGLGEDFIYDQDEALSDPDSDSAKVFNAHVDKMVQGKLNQSMQAQQQAAQRSHLKDKRKQEAVEFIKKHNLSQEQFMEFVEKAKQRPLSLEDAYYVINKDKAAANVAKSTKDDMLTQMKAVREMPTSASGVNSPRADRSPDDQVFDDLFGGSSRVDDLFS